MKDGPNIVGIAALIGDHARAEILTALTAGQALTATELAGLAGVTKQTVSAHLAKLLDARLVAGIGIDVEALVSRRRPLCRACLDWSVRRHHLAGALGAALLDRCFELGWARRAKGSRVVNFSPSGEQALRERFH